MLVEQGPALELKDVALRAGVAEGSLYYHFKNRAGLLAALVEDHHHRLEERFSMIRFEGRRWLDREKARIAEMVRYYYADPVAVLIVQIVRQDPILMDLDIQQQDKLVSVGARNIQEAQRAGEIPTDLDPILLVAMLLKATEVGILTALSQPNPKPEAEVSQEVVGFVARAAGVVDAP